MARFLLIWLGQVFAGCGANLATFCLGIWLYRHSESVTQFSLLLFFNTIPPILLAGAAGRVADRRNRRATMMLSDGLNALVALAYLAIFHADMARPWLVYLLAFTSGCLSAFQWPAYRSWSSELVAARDFGRVGGIMKLGEGIPFLLGPVLGGALMAKASLSTVFGIDLGAYLVSFVVLALAGIRGAAPERRASSDAATTAMWSPLAAFLRAHPGLLGLLVLTPLIVFTEGWVVTLFQPFMLHHLDATHLGLMLSLGGTGMVAGGIAMGVWGGPRRQIFSVLAAIFAQTLIVGFLALVEPTFISGTIAAFLYFASIPFLSGSNQAIWQTLTPLELQGRMFAFRRATESVATPASLITAGVLVDFVLKPLLSRDAALGFVTEFVPSGPSQPMAVLFLSVSILNLIFLAVALLWRPVRRVDLELPPHPRAIAELNREALQSTEAAAVAGRPA